MIFIVYLYPCQAVYALVMDGNVITCVDKAIFVLILTVMLTFFWGKISHVLI